MKRCVAKTMVLAVAGAVAIAGCVGTDEAVPLSVPSSPNTVSDSPTTAPTVSVPVVPETQPDWATRSVVVADPFTLESLGPEVPAGLWVEGAVLTEDLMAFATWPEDDVSSGHGRWRLVVADRRTGIPTMTREVGDMNILGMFAAPSGEVMVVEPIRSSDQNSADGFVIHGYDPTNDTLREAARYEVGDFFPSRVTVLPGQLIGLTGYERNNSGTFDRMRIVVFDWEQGIPVVDMVLDDIAIQTEAPEGMFVGYLGHAVAWDTVRNRALIVKADEDVVTAVEYPSGDVETVDLVESRSLLGAFFSWLIPPVQAKGLPASSRNAVIVGDRMYVAGAAMNFSESEDGTQYTYSPIGMIAVDLETLEIVGRTEAPVGFVASTDDGRYLLGGGRFESGLIGEYATRSDNSSSGLFVFDRETLDVIATSDTNVESLYDLVPAASGPIVYINDLGRGILIFDSMTGVISTTGVNVTWEPTLLRLGLRNLTDR